MIRLNHLHGGKRKETQEFRGPQIDEPDALARVARAALGNIARFRDDGTDELADAPDEERCERRATTACCPTAKQTARPRPDRVDTRSGDLLLALARSTTTAEQSRPDPNEWSN